MAKTFDLGLDQLSMFPVVQKINLSEQAPCVASTPDGRFAIAYQVGKKSAPPNYDIWLARYSGISLVPRPRSARHRTRQ